MANRVPTGRVGTSNVLFSCTGIKIRSEPRMQVVDKHAPWRVAKTRQKRIPKPSTALRNLRRQRDNARSKGDKSKLRKLRAQCKGLGRKEYLNDITTRLEKKNSTAWNIVKEITGTGDKSAAVIMQDTIALSPEEAARRFNEFFISKIAKIKDGIGGFAGSRVRGAEEKAKELQLKQDSFCFKTVSEREITSAIKRSKPSKCPDIAGVSPAMLKLAPDIVSVPLTFIINTIIRQEEIPSSWKVARVLPLHKKLSKNQMENYRPVSILPTASKVLEEVLRKQMAWYLEENGVLPSSQFGFRARRSTVQATGAAIHDWQEAKEKGLECGALQFDLSAAFDTISADLLIQKLQIYGAGRNVRNILRSYLSGRKQRVDYADSSSGLVDVQVGSPQGSCLSPLLYITLIADLDEWIGGSKAITYADDSSVYVVARTKEEVRKGLEVAAEQMLSFFQASFLAANATKTKFVMFGRKQEEPIRVGTSIIEESEAEELLGFTYNKALTWRHHLDKIETELRKRIGVLRRLTWHLPQNVLVKMVEPLFTSKMRYGVELIVDCLTREDAALKRLHSLHRLAMKASLSIPTRNHPTDVELLQRTGQKSVFEMAMVATANMAWRAGQDWDRHPLTKGRIKKHQVERRTRQLTKRTLPPQWASTGTSLVSRLVEIWERLPVDIKEEKCEGRVKLKINKWIGEEISRETFL